MNHYCTYFDSGFAIQGLALWRSLEAHDPEAVLWVLALDDKVAQLLRPFSDARLRVVPLAELERSDRELAAVKSNRSLVEYYFTLSPCWPLRLLVQNPEIERITYLDADLFFFSSPKPIFDEMEVTGASVVVTSHRFAWWLSHYDKHGRFNVGILVFANDEHGRECLEDWRSRCLEWCYDRLEDGKYADQKYLDDWPEMLGAHLLVLDHPGVNLAPWNWIRHQLTLGDNVEIDDAPLILFHFARFKPVLNDRWWHSGQLDYGVMPRRWRETIYTPYWRALVAARNELREVVPEFDFVRRQRRFNPSFWRSLPQRIAFGGNWLRLGDQFYNLRLGAGQLSGRVLVHVRRRRNERRRARRESVHSTT